ncbi:hypothetical protein R1sor_009615 [Riccia sorocarpa]|uniref:Uncharacterized protein n=1 Tax=Riccia sorocarpa TaxID=122646 RepID=A0ABD3I1R2_9MARC
MQTMGRKSHKEVISLVCCSDSTFAEFEKFVARWKKGEVPDVHGVVGPVENERALKLIGISRNFLYKEEFDTWDELATSYTIPGNWLEGMLKFDKGDKEVDGEDISSSDAKEDDSSKKKKSQERRPLWMSFHHRSKRDFIGSIVRNMERQHLSGLNPVDFCTELKEMKDARVIIECGCYEAPRLHREVEFSFPFWQLVYALINLGFQDYQPSLKNSVQMRPYSMEYQPKGAGEDFVEEKGTASAAIQTNIKIKAPQWGFVGMASPDGSAHVHPVCKRRRFCNRMLNNFSSEGSTVLDFFSGGVFAREALMLQRDVIYFANSQEEAEFVDKYGKSLVSYSERVRHWFAKYKSAKKSASTIQQPAILAKEHANTEDDHIPGDQKEKTPFVFEEVFATNALKRLGKCRRVVEIDMGTT